MEMRLYFMQTRSGLHCGIGQGLSDIDLPTAKDPVTGHPLVPGSSLKGVLRDRFDDGSDKFFAAFGSAPGGHAEFAAALSFTDSHMICLPVRSYFGTFAHLASPCTLSLLKEELKTAGKTGLPSVPVFVSSPESNTYYAAVTAVSRLLSAGQFANRLLLEELDPLVAEEFQETADQWAQLIAGYVYPDDEEAQTLFCRGFAIVDDNIMNFYCETALPVAAHNTVGENGVVVDGALWYEEYVPAESIFIGAVYGENGKGEANAVFTADNLLELVCAEQLDIQVGGSATTGRGLVSIVFASGSGGE